MFYIYIFFFYITWAWYAVAFAVKRNVALLMLIVGLEWWLKKTGGVEPSWVAVWNHSKRKGLLYYLELDFSLCKGLFYYLELDFSLCSSGICPRLQKYT